MEMVMKMKKEKIVKVLIPAIMAATFLYSCASSTDERCYNDACYNRKIASVDPYKEGQLAAWGSEEADDKDDTRDKSEGPKRPPGSRMELPQ